ncbi:MAG: helix-turn-helix transcriptional regulator [Leptospiraceae bacterium]|nr:helix-turn-helix transcriptional regulator [Leptospiraceae bacterium]
MAPGRSPTKKSRPPTKKRTARDSKDSNIPSPSDLQLGDRIRKLREARGLSRRELAERIQTYGSACSEASLRIWELNKSVPGSDKIPALHQALDADLYELFGLPRYDHFDFCYALNDARIRDLLRAVEGMYSPESFRLMLRGFLNGLRFGFGVRKAERIRAASGKHRKLHQFND